MLVGSFLGGDNQLGLVVALMIGPWLLNAWASDMLLWRCDVRRKVPDRVMAGEVLSVEVIVENRKRLMPSWLVLASDQIENDAEVLESQVLFARVPGGDCRSGYYRMRPGRRGRYRLGPIELSTRFPLGRTRQHDRDRSRQAPHLRNPSLLTIWRYTGTNRSDAARSRRSHHRSARCRNPRIYVCIPVSYTHLTLPTNREV